MIIHLLKNSLRIYFIMEMFLVNEVVKVQVLILNGQGFLV